MAQNSLGELQMSSGMADEIVFAITVPVGAYHPRLRASLASLKAQSPQPRVALMDASGDPRVAAIADEFSDLITYRHHGPDDGQADAIASGWAKISGNVLGWLNADDVLLPGALETAAAAFQTHPAADVVYGQSEIVDDRCVFTGYHWSVAPHTAGGLRTNCFISQPSCFFKRLIYEKVGGLNRALHYTMDWDLWVRFDEADAEFVFVDDVLSSVLWSKEAKTGGFGKDRRAELNAIIGQHPGWPRRLKAMIGFSVHHLLEYVVPDGVARTIRRAIASKAGRKYGIDWCGGVGERASIPLYHYTEIPAVMVEIAYSGCADDVRVVIDDVPQAVDLKPDAKKMRVELKDALGPGIRKTLVLDRPNSGAFFLDGVRLVQAV